MSYCLPLVVPVLFLMNCSAPPLMVVTPEAAKEPSVIVVKFPIGGGLFGPTDWVSYQVLRTNAIDPDSLLKVTVSGEVRYPGSLQIPKGMTIIEAIAKAGGFTDFAFTRYLHVFIGGGQQRERYKLDRHWRDGQVWYGDGMGDYVLQPDTEIHVSRH